MDDRGRIWTTEEIAEREDLRKKLEAGQLEPIADSELEAVRGMNRKQRRAWYAQQRRKRKAARV